MVALGVGFYLNKKNNDSTLYPPAFPSDESSQATQSNKEVINDFGVDKTTSTQTPLTQKKIETQKPSAIPKPPELPQ